MTAKHTHRLTLQRPALDQSIEAAVDAVARLEGTSLDELRSNSRRAPLVRLRRDVARMLRDEEGWSYPRIGQFLNRHHTDVIYLVRE